MTAKTDTTYLKSGERFDDMQYKGLKLIQHPQGYCFTSDSVLLSSFAKLKKGERVADFCSGSGVIAILLAAKNPGVRSVDAVEAQPRLADMARRSVLYNGLEDVVTIHHALLQDYCAGIVSRKDFCAFDTVVFNPPYKKVTANISKNPEVAAARFETLITLEEIIKLSCSVLKHRGKIYTVHTAERAPELIHLLHRYGAQVKTIMPVIPAIGKPPHAVLVHAVKGAASGALWLPPLYILDTDGGYTPEAKQYYNID